jgi:elongation factor G
MSDSTGALNIALVGPYTSGKTTLLESMLFVAGAIGRKGKVTDGNTVGDWSDEARGRQSSVEVNAASFEYRDHRFTILDCPGSIEFFAETANALMGVDLAIIVCTPDLNRVWTMGRLFKFLAQHEIPHVLFANRMDETAVRVAELIEAVQPVSDRPLVPCQVAIRDGDNVNGYVDLITGKAYKYRDQEGAVGVDAPETVSERREDARTQLLESLADFDDTLLERLLEDEIPEPEEIQAYLRGVLADAGVVPVMMGSAERDWGVRRLLESLIDSAPGDALAARRLSAGADGASVAQVVKTYMTQHGGKVSLARVWAGTIEDGMTLNDGQRIGGMYRMQGQQQNKIDKAQAGDIVGLGRLESVSTGDTVAPADGPEVEPMPRADLPSSVYAYAVRASKREDEVKVSGAMSRLAQEDPSLSFQPNPDTQEAVLWGQGEMHLKVALDRLAGKYGLSLQTERPKVAYKEAIRKPVSQHARFKKQTGGRGQFGDCWVRLSPRPRGDGYEFVDNIKGGVIPGKYVPSVDKGIREAAGKGILAGFALVDFAAECYDGSYHSVDSSDIAFKVAGSLAFREVAARAGPVLLEPIIEVEVSTPDEYMGDIMGDITQRRGKVQGMVPGNGSTTVQALVPEAELYKYATALRSMTQGRAHHTRTLAGYEPMPAHEAQQVIEALKAEE